MAKYINQSQWAKYKSIINDFHHDAFQDEVKWYRVKDVISRNGEDESGYENPITLKGLMNYNYFRTWPLTGYSITGEVDKQSTVLILNVAYLSSLGYIDNTTKKLIYRQDKDVIVHRGDYYIPTGDTFVSQAGDEPLLFILILKRQENIPYKLT